MMPCPFFPACSEELTKEVNKPRMKKRTKLIEVHRTPQQYNKYQPLEPGPKIDSCTRRRVIDYVERPVCSFSEQFRRRARLEMMTKGVSARALLQPPRGDHDHARSRLSRNLGPAWGTGSSNGTLSSSARRIYASCAWFTRTASGTQGLVRYGQSARVMPATAVAVEGRGLLGWPPWPSPTLTDDITSDQSSRNWNLRGCFPCLLARSCHEPLG